MFLTKLGIEKNIRAMETLLVILAILGSKDLQKTYDEYLGLLFPQKKKKEQEDIQEGIQLLKKLIEKERGKHTGDGVTHKDGAKFDT
ncbi:MAG: hypothetical protein QXE80_03560 [Pyrobaculum sp.]